MMRILWIGNSYTQRNDLPALIATMASQRQPPVPVEHERVIANGASLRRHWNTGEAVAAIERGPWNYVVLQEQSTLPIKNVVRYHENVRLLYEVIQRHSAQTLLYLVWPRQDVPQTQSTLTEAATTIATETGARIAPVGPAWQHALAAEPGLLLYDKDGSHPTPIGSYLAACVFYATLFRQTPLGLALPATLDIPERVGTLLQSVSWDVVFAPNHLGR
ncbi:MAG: hypothetical protein JWN98_1371 [Abditibacteriota bacterium]|nr:hypothetical protein [Abditibacteriota bacterium]